MRDCFARGSLTVLWLLHFLPLPLLALLGNVTGVLAYGLATRRRRIARTNLRLMQPQLSPVQREWWIVCTMGALMRSVFERPILWYASPKRLQRLIHVEGEAHLASMATPIIFVAPHMAGLEVGPCWLSQRYRGAAVYSRQSNPVFDAALLAGRQRFGAQMFERSNSIRLLLRAFHHIEGLHLMPDLDLGARDAIFVPFFGVSAATITTLPRLAKIARAEVVSVFVKMRPWGSGYDVVFGEAWKNFPSNDLEADVMYMNAQLEAQIMQAPKQYFWVHRRLKTRPEGCLSVYDKVI